MEIFGFVACFLMGIILGVMGGGGAILTVPIMVYLFQYSPLVATSHSLFIVGLTALAGSTMYIRRGDINFKIGLTFAIPSIIGVNLARGLIIPTLPTEILTVGRFTLTKEILVMFTFSVLMVAASYSMIKKRQDLEKQNQPVNFIRLLKLTLQGLLVGLIAGFVGAGGGFLIIPALVLFAGLTMRVAVGTSLMIIALQSLLGFWGDIQRGLHPEWNFLVPVAMIAIVGIFFGALIAQKFKEQKLKVAFGWFVLLMGTSILLEQLRHL